MPHPRHRGLRRPDARPRQRPRAADGDIWIKRKGVALDEVEPDDVVATRRHRRASLHLETVLHTGVYRARPDVGAVVHGHPPYATALGATAAHLELLTHDAVLFADGVGRFDEPDLIVDDDQGEPCRGGARRPRAPCCCSNHGVLVAGKDVPWAVLTAVTLERAARLQSIASTLGELRPIGAELARAAAPRQVPRRVRRRVLGRLAARRRRARTAEALGGDRA